MNPQDPSTITIKTVSELCIVMSRGKLFVADPVRLVSELQKLGDEAADTTDVAPYRNAMNAAGYRLEVVSGPSELTDTEVYQLTLGIVGWFDELGKPYDPTPNSRQ
jgi:hypothetical protein